MIAASTMTMITSRSVKPRCRFDMKLARDRRSVTVHDVAILALAAFPAVGAERNQVVGPALSGYRELVIVAPCVLERLLFDVRPGPLLDPWRLSYERLEAIGILSDLKPVELYLRGPL